MVLFAAAVVLTEVPASLKSIKSLTMGVTIFVKLTSNTPCSDES